MKMLISDYKLTKLKPFLFPSFFYWSGKFSDYAETNCPVFNIGPLTLACFVAEMQYPWACRMLILIVFLNLVFLSYSYSFLYLFLKFLEICVEKDAIMHSLAETKRMNNHQACNPQNVVDSFLCFLECYWPDFLVLIILNNLSAWATET